VNPIALLVALVHGLEFSGVYELIFIVVHDHGASNDVRALRVVSTFAMDGFDLQHLNELVDA
jgi:hypothetical protein